VSKLTVVGNVGILAVACALAGCAWGGPGQESDRNDPKSNTTILREDLSLFPAGKRLYWIGPKKGRFALAQAVRHGDSAAEGVKLTYVPGFGALEIITYRGRVRPAPGQPDQYGAEDDSRTVMQKITSTGQLVVMTISPRAAKISPSVVAELAAALQPIDERDIDALPKSWLDLRR
jgi:hypothetical protein